MENIIMIKGKVQFSITLDPSVWIFDDRKIDLDFYFKSERVEKNELDEYTKEISAHWDREIMEGAILPPTIKTEKKFFKEQLLNGSFGIPLKPFLLNASPFEDAKKLIIKTMNETFALDLVEGNKLILGFSKNGKPLSEDGPVHVFFGDGSNLENPILNVKEIWIE